MYNVFVRAFETGKKANEPYVYYVYLAMSKSSKQPPNVIQKSRNKPRYICSIVTLPDH